MSCMSVAKSKRSFRFHCHGFWLFFTFLFLLLARDYAFSRLFLVHIRPRVTTFVAAVVIPSTLPPIVIVPEDERIHGRRVALRILDRSHPMELFADRPLNNYVLLVLQVLGLRIEVELVIVGIRHDHFGFVHVN